MIVQTQTAQWNIWQDTRDTVRKEGTPQPQNSSRLWNVPSVMIMIIINYW